MANGDTKTNQYLDIAAHGTRADFPASCCETRSQTLIREVGERIMDVEDEVERLENNPDVVDIVATYADLQVYDTTSLTDKDIIRVLEDSTHDGNSTYYRWNATTNQFDFVGEIAGGTEYTAGDALGQIALGATTGISSARYSQAGVMSIQAGNTLQGYNNTVYRLLEGLYDGQSDHDAVNVSQVNSVIDAINTALSTNIPHIGA